MVKRCVTILLSSFLMVGASVPGYANPDCVPPAPNPLERVIAYLMQGMAEMDTEEIESPGANALFGLILGIAYLATKKVCDEQGNEASLLEVGTREFLGIGRTDVVEASPTHLPNALAIETQGAMEIILRPYREKLERGEELSTAERQKLDEFYASW